MCTDRRDFLRASAGFAGAALLGGRVSFAQTIDLDPIQQRKDVPDIIKNLRPMMSGVAPITDDERKARIAKARRLMTEQKIDAGPEHVLLHRYALEHQRAHVRFGDPAARRTRLGLSKV